MFSPSLIEALLLQALVTVAAYLLFFDKKQLPPLLQFVTVIVYITSPAIVAEKGVQSALYLADLLLPFLLAYVLLRKRNTWVVTDQRFLAVFLLLIVFPLLAGLAVLSFGGGDVDLLSRENKSTILWYYRNLTFLFVFALGIVSRADSNQAIAWLRLNVILASPLVLFGLLNYLGSFNFSTFEVVIMQQNAEELSRLQHNRVGSGFMGMHRGAVGQWFGSLVIILLGSLSCFSRRWRLWVGAVVMGSICIVLFSYSRAGLVGLGVGVIVLAFFGRRPSQRIYGLLGLLLIVASIASQYDVVGERVLSIWKVEDNSSAVRVSGWQRSLEVFSSDNSILLFGIGPTNRQRVFELVGTYGAHNEYLDSIYRMGLLGPIGLLFVLIVLTQTFLKIRNKMDERTRIFGSSALAVLFGNAAMALTQANFLQDYSGYTCGLYLFLLYGIVAGMETKRHQGKSESLDQVPLTTNRHEIRRTEHARNYF